MVAIATALSRLRDQRDLSTDTPVGLENLVVASLGLADFSAEVSVADRWQLLPLLIPPVLMRSVLAGPSEVMERAVQQLLAEATISDFMCLKRS